MFYCGNFNSSEKADFSAVFLLKLCQKAEVAAFFITDSVIVIRYAEHVDSGFNGFQNQKLRIIRAAGRKIRM